MPVSTRPEQAVQAAYETGLMCRSTGLHLPHEIHDILTFIPERTPWALLGPWLLVAFEGDKVPRVYRPRLVIRSTRWFAERSFGCHPSRCSGKGAAGRPLRHRGPGRRVHTTLVAPTSRSARPATFRPMTSLDDTETRVLVEQTTVVDPERLGRSAGRLDADELRAVDEALALVLGP